MIEFDFIFSNAVWMHLDEIERSLSLKSVASLLRPKGKIVLSFRFGPIPEGRRMFEVDVEAFCEEAQDFGFEEVEIKASLSSASRPDSLGRTDVSWTKVCLQKRG